MLPDSYSSAAKGAAGCEYYMADIRKFVFLFVLRRPVFIRIR